MQWNLQQWLESLVWIAQTYLSVLVGFAVGVAGLGRFARRGEPARYASGEPILTTGVAIR
jgi:hypothetical protein